MFANRGHLKTYGIIWDFFLQMAAPPPFWEIIRKKVLWFIFGLVFLLPDLGKRDHPFWEKYLNNTVFYILT